MGAARKKLGILGGGQLASMMALRCHSLGIQTIVVDPHADCAASIVTPVVVYDFDQEDEIEKALSSCDAVTYEFENIPLSLIRRLEKNLQVYPSSRSLEVTQHRYTEKQFVSSLRVSVGSFSLAKSQSELQEILKGVSVEGAVIKSCSDGYDGKGQWRYKRGDDIVKLCSDIFSETSGSQEYIVEDFVDFDYEASCIAVRALSGQVSFYPMCENEHVSGTLLQTLVPGERITQAISKKAIEATKMIIENLDHVGVLTVEFFVKGDEIVFNEYAPRVHNSGHWSIEGAYCSQFENHVRACLGLPLGSTESSMCTVMLNLLGHDVDLEAVQKIPGANYHWYNKEIRPGRKVGHVTLCTETVEERSKLLPQLSAACGIV